MHPRRYNSSQRGVTFIELLVGAAVMSLIFAGILGSFQILLTLVAHTKSQSGAVAIANEKIEFMRALPYNDVGTIAGIPPGNIPQNEVVTLNNVQFNVRTLVQYVDAPEDGTGAGDSNGITADYKRAKVELTWDVKGQGLKISLVTNIVPKGIETVAGGGTLQVNVFNASVQPVEDAAVRVVNASTSPAVDVTSYTNAAGLVSFPGALASGGYEISVTKPGYSSSQTYSASSSNPNPNPPHVAVVEGDVSTVNFAIDKTSTVTVETVAPPSVGSFQDPFDDASLIALLATTTTSGGSLVLTGAPGPYPPLGEVYATATEPSPLDSWTQAVWSDSVPANTSVTYHVYSVDGGGTRTLIPDGDLPGNAAGFSASPIDLTGLLTGTYPRLALGATLQSTDGVSTPSIDEWELSYVTSVTPIGNVAFYMRGSKDIGTDGGGALIYKYTSTTTTDGGGQAVVGSMEWDQYQMSIDGAAEGYDIRESCPPQPLNLPPDTATTTTLTLEAHTNNTLLVVVKSAGGSLISGADVHLTRAGYDETEATSLCGQSFFGGLTSAADYTLETSAAGYITDTQNNIDITGQNSLIVQLST